MLLQYRSCFEDQILSVKKMHLFDLFCDIASYLYLTQRQDPRTKGGAKPDEHPESSGLICCHQYIKPLFCQSGQFFLSLTLMDVFLRLGIV